MGKTIFGVLIGLLFLYVVFPLLMPFVMGAVFTVLIYPIYKILIKKKMSQTLAAFLLTLIVTIGFIIPVAFLLFFAAKTGVEQVKAIQAWSGAHSMNGDSSVYESIINSPGMQRLVERISGIFPVEAEEIISTLRDLLGAVGLKLADLLTGALTQLPNMLMALTVLVFTMFFLLLDGQKLVSFLRRHSVFGPLQTERLIGSFGTMCRSVILATVVSGSVQAVIFTLACLIVGSSSVALIALLTFLGSFIPLVGSAIVTVPVAVFAFMNGETGDGIVLVIAAAIVAVVDNFIRPLVLKGSGNLHPLVAFMSAFGGLKVFGISGVFLGPIVAGMFMVTLHILTHAEHDPLIPNTYD